MGQLPIHRRNIRSAIVVVAIIALGGLSYTVYANHSTISSLKSEITSKDQMIHSKENLIEEQKVKLGKQSNYIAQTVNKLEEKNSLIDSQKSEIKQLSMDLTRLKEVKRSELQAHLKSLEEKKKKSATLASSNKALPKPVALSRSKGSVSGDWVITFYSLDYASTGKKPGDKGFGITASGAKVKDGRTAACPPSLKSGTRLHIEGLGTRVCEDTGSAIKGKKIDIYVANKTTKELYQSPYGKWKNVGIKILTND